MSGTKPPHGPGGSDRSKMRSDKEITSNTVASKSKVKYYEGCGEEGPIKAIFISEFHHIAGPKILVQTPKDSISKEVFDALSCYIIPKTHLQRLTVTINALGQKIVGYPIRIINEKYERNAFYFNICFVCDVWAKTAQYERVLMKVAEFLHNLEIEQEFLSKELGSGSLKFIDEMSTLLNKILTGLNCQSRHCSLVFRERLLSLKVVPVVRTPPPYFGNHQVPVFIVDIEPMHEWDLTTQKIIPYVDGFHHVIQISYLADVELSLVRSCLQSLLYYNVIKMITTFQYGNVYCVSPGLHQRFACGGSEFRNECLKFVARSENCLPNGTDVMRFYCSMKRGVTMKDLCQRFSKTKAAPTTLIFNIDYRKYSVGKYSDGSSSASTLSRTSSAATTPIKVPVGKTSTDFQSVFSVIDEKKLVLFGLIHDMIHRVEKYPILHIPPSVEEEYIDTPNGINYFNGDTSYNNSSCIAEEPWILQRKTFASLYAIFDGKHTYDEICLTHTFSQTELDNLIDADPDVYVIWK